VKKILVLESDSMVVDALANEFAVYGCMVDAVDDAEMARQKASSDSFALVIISTTLAKSHGFLAFTFLKRLPELENIPFVIIYNEGEGDQIVSHQNRPTHADVYIQKPFDFNELLATVAPYIGVQDQLEPVADAPEGTEEIEIDDAVVLETDDEAVSIDDAEVQSLADISDAELAALDTPTDEGFEQVAVGGDLPEIPDDDELAIDDDGPDFESVAIEDEDKKALAPEQDAPDEPEVAAVEPSAAVNAGALAEANEKVVALRAEVESLTIRADEASGLVEKAEHAKRDAEQEVDTLKSKISDLEKAMEEKGAASVSTRELLDLRELINRKDKEILNLKDDVNAKEKELLAERDKLMVKMRSIADFEDKVAANDKELRSLTDKLGAVTKDKETAAKRADDFKAHWDSTKEDIEGLKAEIEALRTAHSQELQQTEESIRKEGDEARALALKEQESRLNDEKDGEIGSLKISQERTLQELKDQYEAEIFDIRDKFDTDLKEYQDKSDKDKQDALSALKEEYESKLGEAEAATKAREEQLDEEVKEKDQINKALMRESASQDKQIGVLTETVSGLEAAGEELQARLADLTAEKEKLSAEFDTLKSHAESLAAELEGQKNNHAEAVKHIGATDDLLSDVAESLQNITSLLEGRGKFDGS
jgi:DNA-binding response OmpR family regulator/chromosome segregation ATPase